ncbi:unnamed protein product, partial [Rotaria magnacalcarata]
MEHINTAYTETYSTGESSKPWSVAVSDFNNDSHVDAVVANPGTGSIGVLLGNSYEISNIENLYYIDHHSMP